MSSRSELLHSLFSFSDCRVCVWEGFSATHESARACVMRMEAKNLTPADRLVYSASPISLFGYKHPVILPQPYRNYNLQARCSMRSVKTTVSCNQTMSTSWLSSVPLVIISLKAVLDSELCGHTCV